MNAHQRTEEDGQKFVSGVMVVLKGRQTSKFMNEIPRHVYVGYT